MGRRDLERTAGARTELVTGFTARPAMAIPFGVNEGSPVLPQLGLFHSSSIGRVCWSETNLTRAIGWWCERPPGSPRVVDVPSEPFPLTPVHKIWSH